jgi:RpiB/LacA/LacB family sugar-phosphate isomerase
MKKLKSDIVLASDHGGFELKEDIREYLIQEGYQVQDLGPPAQESVDYPLFGSKIAELVSRGEAERGILICGSGIGMCIVANKYPNVRAALCHDQYTSFMSRCHNDANILVLGGRILGKGLAREVVKIWLETEFEGGRHSRRLEQIRALEQELGIKK